MDQPVLMPVVASFRTHENIWEYDWKKKTIANKDEYMSESVFDCDAWHEATVRQDTNPLIRTSQTAKKARANEARYARPSLYESMQDEASVSIYILALALSWVLPARVYSRH